MGETLARRTAGSNSTDRIGPAIGGRRQREHPFSTRIVDFAPVSANLLALARYIVDGPE
jgi:hypothetical protein